MTLRAISLWIMLSYLGAAGASLADTLGNPVQVFVETPKQIQQGWEARGYKSQVSGWATYWGTPPNIWACQVHVPPLTPKTLWIWRHELKHCTDGRFHE